MQNDIQFLIFKLLQAGFAVRSYRDGGCQISWGLGPDWICSTWISMLGEVTKITSSVLPTPTPQTTLSLPRCCSTLSCPPESKPAGEGAQRGFPAASSGSLNRWSLFRWPRGSGASSLCPGARQRKQQKKLTPASLGPERNLAPPAQTWLGGSVWGSNLILTPALGRKARALQVCGSLEDERSC